MKRYLIFPIYCLLFPVSAHCAAINADAPKTIIAPKIEYNIKTESIKTTGKTEISNTAGQRVTLLDSYLDSNGMGARGSNIEMTLGDNVYVRADEIKYENSDTTARGAMFTACHGCDDFGNAWEISTSRLVHNSADKMISFKNPVFYAYDVPVFWFPYMEYPDPSVKHKSGLMFPSFNSTNNMGTQINIPVHLAFSDTHDATVTMSYLSQENPLLQIEHRLNAPHSEFRTAGSFTRNLDGENRWHIMNRDNIDLGTNMRASVFVARASDNTYLQKYGFYDDQPYLDSGARLEMFGQRGYVVSEAHLFQELRSYRRNRATPDGDILPNIRGTWRTKNLFGETYADFNADILGVVGGNSSSQRASGTARITSPWTLWGGNRVTLAGSARYDLYNFNNTIMTDGGEFSGVKSRFLPSAYAQWGLPLAKAGENWTYVIEPRARITTMTDVSDPVYAMNNDSAGALLSDATLFSDNRYAGLDLWENGTFADYGARAAAFDASGRTWEFFAGQTYDFDRTDDVDPNSGFRRGASDYVGRAGYDNADWLAVSSRFRFARDGFNLRHMETDARFGGGRNYLSAGHIWAAQYVDAVTPDRTIHEVSGGFGIGLTDRVSMRFNAIYNITDERFQRHTGGLYYNHPCYYLALEYRRDNAAKADYVGNTTFQLKFGLAINGVKQSY